MSISYLNGEWQAIEDAKVSVLDRGFLFGDGVYEVIPVYEKKPFNLTRHLQRLSRSLEEIKLPNPHSIDEWQELISDAISRSGESNAALYMQITRGVGTKRDFVYPDVVEATIFIMVSEAPLLERKSVKPYEMITLEDFRWSRGHIKTVSLIAAGMLKNEAISQGANDAILIKDGKVTECTSSNIFVVLNGVIVTPPKSNQMLHGITRDVIVELARENNMLIEEREITPEELLRADEMFLSSSTHEAWPINKLDGQVIGNGEAGILWHQIDELFQANKLA